MSPQLVNSLKAICQYLAGLPDFSVERTKTFLVSTLVASLMDFTNPENLSFQEERTEEIVVCGYDKKRWDQLSSALKEVEEEIKNPFADISLELSTVDRGYLMGVGNITVLCRLKFKKDKRDLHAALSETQKLRVFPDEVLDELAEKISAEPRVLEGGQRDTLFPGERQKLGGGTPPLEVGLTRGPGAP